MNNPFLWKKMVQVQVGYRELLQKIQCYVETNDFQYIINEIGVFWYSKRKITDLFLRYSSEDRDAYLFCGASYLNFEANEHYPFLAVGNIHIVDDPLAKYAATIKKSMNTSFYQSMKKQIILGLTDNMHILENLMGKIILLPVTDAANFSDKLGGLDPAMDLLLSMFRESIDEKQLFAVTDFDILISKFRDDALDLITFSEEDRPGDTMKEKIERHLASVGDIYGDIPLSQKFLFTILGYFNQAIDIFMMCSQYGLIPYIRYDVVFRNMLIIGDNFLASKELRFLIEGMVFAHCFYHCFDIQAVAHVNIDKYINKVEEITQNMYWDKNIAEEEFSSEIANSIRDSAKKSAVAICAAFA